MTRTVEIPSRAKRLIIQRVAVCGIRQAFLKRQSTYHSKCFRKPTSFTNLYSVDTTVVIILQVLTVECITVRSIIFREFALIKLLDYGKIRWPVGNCSIKHQFF